MNELRLQGKVNREPFYTSGKFWKATIVTENDRGYKAYFDAIAFNEDADKYNELGIKEGDELKAMGECRRNEYNGYVSIQLVINKLAKVASAPAKEEPEWTDAEDLEW